MISPAIDMGFGNQVTFFGRVEDRDDPLKLGRVRVRIYGVHSEDTTLIPNETLPWAPCLQGIVSAATNKIGISPTGLLVGSTVFGIFLDGNYQQQPFVLGTYAGNPNDVSDVSGLADGSESLEKGSAPQEPADSANPKYPYNQVFTSEAGHVIEVDNTPGAERINIYHKSGTYFEMRQEGDHVLRVAKDSYDIILGDKTVYVQGDVNINVQGDVTATVAGQVDVSAKGSIAATSEKSIKIFAPDIEIQEVSQEVNAQVFADHILMSREGWVAAYDDDIEDAPEEIRSMYPSEFTDGSAPLDEVNDAAYTNGPRAGRPVDCIDVKVTSNNIPGTDPIYNTRLSPNFTIASLTTKAHFAHTLQETSVISIPDAICNMKALCENVLEPLRAKYPGFRINSGFRPKTGGSRHNRGMAVDLQWPGVSNSKYLEISKWIAENIPADQIFLEHGKGLWIHIAYDRTLKSQRRIIKTMVNNEFVEGLKLFR